MSAGILQRNGEHKNEHLIIKRGGFQLELLVIILPRYFSVDLT